jgi:hypothetical protein
LAGDPLGAKQRKAKVVARAIKSKALKTWGKFDGKRRFVPDLLDARIIMVRVDCKMGSKTCV